MSDALNVKIAKAFLEISATHYPERLGAFILLDAPPLFTMLWKAIQSFVDPKTYKKIRFVPFDPKAKDSKLVSFLASRFDPPVAEWLIREATENRDTAKVKAKSYHVGEIHRSASDGQLEGLCGQLESLSVPGDTVAEGSDSTAEGSGAGAPAEKAVVEPVKEKVGAFKRMFKHSKSADEDKTGAAAGAMGVVELGGRQHDHRGTCALLQLYHERPEILEPQGSAMRADKGAEKSA
ncbi:hypothetical protein FOA52_005402 [Chlamydomonas sp. UWO 241]|nr:hypothetical protein FOA52_005402 [Chlamydomonas sp. UWO 241]